MVDSTEAWLTVVALAVTSAATRAAGPVALGGRTLSPRLTGIIELLAPALLAALVVVQTVGEGQAIEIDARLAGVLAAGGLLWFRRSAMLGAIVLAAAVTALLRAL
jgi:uncharacterized membrane protein